MKFLSTEEFEEYLLKDNYGIDPLIPAVCFGYKISEFGKNDYELELMFNDLWPEGSRGIPSQKYPAADPTIQYPLFE
jgi:hypothetical protein